MELDKDKLTSIVERLKEEFHDQGVVVMVSSGNGQIQWSSNLSDELLVIYFRNAADFIEKRS